MKRIDVFNEKGELVATTMAESLAAAQAAYAQAGLAWVCILSAQQQDEAPPAPPVPQRVPMADALHVLLDHGITSAAIRQKIAAIQDDVQRERAEIDFERMDYMRRNSGLVESMAQAFGLSDDVVDGLFTAAAQRAAQA